MTQAAADFATVLSDPHGPGATVTLTLHDGTVLPGVRAVVRSCGSLPPLWIGALGGPDRNASWAEVTLHVDALADPAALKLVTVGTAEWRAVAWQPRMGGGAAYAHRIACKGSQRLPGRSS